MSSWSVLMFCWGIVSCCSWHVCISVLKFFLEYYLMLFLTYLHQVFCGSTETYLVLFFVCLH
jgi:hypothetical protein